MLNPGIDEGTIYDTREKYVHVPVVPRRYPWFVIMSMPVLRDGHDSVSRPEK